MSMPNTSLSSAYEAASSLVQPSAKKPYSHMARRCEELLHGIEVADADVLEVGTGNGFLAHYLATYRNVRHVVALDEYEGHGSARGNHDMNLAMQKHLNNSDVVDVVRCNFNTYTSDHRFSHVFFVNVLHHMVPSSEPGTSDEATRILRHASGMMKQGGTIIIQETSPINLCPIPKYREEMRNVSFKDKLESSQWRAALMAAGFDHIQLRYRLPLNLPWNPFLRRCFNSYVASLLTDSSYVLQACAASRT